MDGQVNYSIADINQLARINLLELWPTDSLVHSEKLLLRSKVTALFKVVNPKRLITQTKENSCTVVTKIKQIQTLSYVTNCLFGEVGDPQGDPRSLPSDLAERRVFMLNDCIARLGAATNAEDRKELLWHLRVLKRGDQKAVNEIINIPPVYEQLVEELREWVPKIKNNLRFELQRGTGTDFKVMSVKMEFAFKDVRSEERLFENIILINHDLL